LIIEEAASPATRNAHPGQIPQSVRFSCLRFSMRYPSVAPGARNTLACLGPTPLRSTATTTAE